LKHRVIGLLKVVVVAKSRYRFFCELVIGQNMGSVSLIGKSMGIGFVRNRHSLDSLPPPLRIELFFDSVNGKKGSFLENELH
jgi:hypothetical protein